ncbi:MAG: acyltransferase family protein [Pseudomonadota bacterium]
MTQPAPSLRRADLDWIRVAAFGLLILFHVSLVYAPWDWHVHSEHSFAFLRETTLITGPWRLTLLFLVSGAALRFMARRLTAPEVLKARMARLVPPLLFGVLVLVPPQSWIEALEKGWWSAGFTSWWISEFSLSGLADGTPLNHLWFVLYIGVYSLAAAALMTRPALLATLEGWLERSLTGWRLLVLPVLYLAVARQLLFPWFGISNQLQADWYNHAMSLAAFLFGFAVAGREGVWAALERQRWRALVLALAGLALLIGLDLHPNGRLLAGSLKNAAFAIEQWATIAAVLGFGSRHLRAADGPLLRYLTDAVFPCYLIHQTILVAAAHLAKPWRLPAAAEAALLVAATLGGSLLVYEIVRRSGPLRPLWGLKRRPAAPAPPRAAAPGPAPAEIA